MSTASSEGIRRHTAANPCKICGGFDRARRGNGDRCFGFLSSDGLYEHCTREELAGQLLPEPKSGTYAHKLNGECKCGRTHGPALTTFPPPGDRRAGAKGPRPAPPPRAKPAPKPAAKPSTRKGGSGLGVHTHAYAYLDAKGEFLFEVRRYVDRVSGEKTFRQWSKDDRDTWVMRKGDRPDVPYHLPRLLASSHDRVAWIVEGEKDVETMEALGQVATCNPGGAGKWRDDFGAYFKGRTCYVVADHDEVGRKHAQQVARSVAPHAEAVKVLDLVELVKAGWAIPEKGDVSDAVALGATVEDLEFFADRAPAWSAEEAAEVLGEPWGEPMLREAAPARPFPLDVFPAGLRSFVAEVARCMAAPVDFPAVAALTLAGSAIGRSLSISLKQSWTEPPMIFAALVGGSSACKTPPLMAMASAVFDIEAELREAHEDAVAAWKEAKLRVAADRKAIGKAEAADLDPPPPRQLVCDDATCEALAPLMARNPRGLVMVRDELTAWLTGMNQYKSGGKGSDRQFFLYTWSGSPVIVNRKGTADAGPIHIPHPFLSIVGGIQPRVLAKVEDMDSGDGFLERILFTQPDPVKVRWVEDSVPASALGDWRDVVRRLWDRPMHRGDDGRDRPFVVGLTPEAKALWLEWHDPHCAEIDDPDFPSQLAATWMKFRSYAARFALILDQLDWAYDPSADARPRPVGAEAMRGALALVEYFKDHVQRVREFWKGGDPIADEAALGLVAWFRKKRVARFTEREARNRFRRRFPIDGPELAKSLGWLDSRKCVRPVPPDPAESRSGRPTSPAWEVNPDLLTLPLPPSLNTLGDAE